MSLTTNNANSYTLSRLRQSSTVESYREEETQLFGHGLLDRHIDGETNFTWNIRECQFRPTMKTFQTIIEGNKNSPRHSETYLKFLFNSTYPHRPTSPVIKLSNIEKAGVEGEVLLKLPRTETENMCVFAVMFPFKVQYYNVMRRFFYGKKIDITSLPDGIELFAEEMGLIQLFKAIFLGRIKSHFGSAQERTLSLEAVMRNMISYYGQINEYIPLPYMDMFLRTLSIEFDTAECCSSTELRREKQKIFLFVKEQGHIRTLIELASDIGSHSLAIYLFELLVECRHHFQDDEMVDILNKFDWRDSYLRSFIERMNEIDCAFWRNLAMAKADFRLPAFPAHVIQVPLPKPILGYIYNSDCREPDFVVHDMTIDGYGPGEEMFYRGFSIHQHLMMSLYLVQNSNTSRFLYLFIRNEFEDLPGWEARMDGIIWPEVSFTEKDCACMIPGEPLVRWGRYANQSRSLVEEIRLKEGCLGDVVMLFDRNELSSWLRDHSEHCSLFLRIRLLPERQLARLECYW